MCDQISEYQSCGHKISSIISTIYVFVCTWVYKFRQSHQKRQRQDHSSYDMFSCQIPNEKWDLYFAHDIFVVSSAGISLIFICFRVTPGLCRPTSVTRRSVTGALQGMYERTRIPSRFVPVRPGPPATNCRDAPGRTRDSVNKALSECYVYGVIWKTALIYYCDKY